MTPPSRLEDRADVQISIVLLASWAAITLAGKWGNWPPDLSALYMAGYFWSEGRLDLIYAAPPNFFGPGVESWQAALTELGHEEESFFPFVYPPLWAALAGPFTARMDPLSFFNAVYAIHISMIAISVWLAYRLVRPEIPLALWSAISCALLFLSLIASSALLHNQFQITVSFLIILSLERYRAGASIAAGMALGLAAAIKISPAALGIIFLLDRDWRAASATAITGLACLALSLALAGPALHVEFAQRLGTISEQVAVMHVNWNLESLLLQLKTLLLGPPLHDLAQMPNMAVPEPGWITAITPLLALSGIGLVLLRTGHLAHQTRLWLRAMGLIIILTMAAPLGWSHHYLPVLLLLPGVFTCFAPVTAIAVLAAFGGLTSLGVFTASKSLSASVHAPAMLNAVVILGLFALLFARRPGLENPGRSGEPDPGRK